MMSIVKVMYSRSRRYKKLVTGHRSSEDDSSSSDRAARPCAPGRERCAMMLCLIRRLLAQVSIVDKLCDSRQQEILDSVLPCLPVNTNPSMKQLSVAVD